VDRVCYERDDRRERDHELDPGVEAVDGTVAVGKPLDLEEVLDHGKRRRGIMAAGRSWRTGQGGHDMRGRARAVAIPSSASSTV